MIRLEDEWARDRKEAIDRGTPMWVIDLLDRTMAMLMSKRRITISVDENDATVIIGALARTIDHPLHPEDPRLKLVPNFEARADRLAHSINAMFKKEFQGWED